MPTREPIVFDLPENLAAKADPALISGDEEQFAAMAATIESTVEDLTTRLGTARRAPGGEGQHAMDRDQEIHRLRARLRTLQRFGLDVCLGRMVRAQDSSVVYVGRIGVADDHGGRLLVDWRSPAAEPFFAATHAQPMGLASRRRYRWTAGRITDYWDEVFTEDGYHGHAALDDQSAFIASLGSSRSPRMRDVLGTIQADQDAIIRAGSRGALVVDGGPGTGKTVVALHRTAYHLYADPRLGHHRGGVLFVGPSRPYLTYVEDVLPSLGEEGVQMCTLRDLVAEGGDAALESDPEVARLKASADLLAAIEPAVGLYEEPPPEGIEVQTHDTDVWLSPDDWAEAFRSPDPGTTHNDARDVVREALIDIAVDKLELDDDVTPAMVRRSLAQNDELNEACGRLWPLIEAADLVGDLWTVPAYLRMCAPWLTPDEVRSLQRRDPAAWTVSDLPLLDAARQRLGDPEAVRVERRRRRAAEARRRRMDDVVEQLIESDSSEMRVMSMLRGADLQEDLVDEAGLPDASARPLDRPFAHVVVDEGQELTDAEWRMVLSRCPSRSLTVVGDRAQARHGFAETWQQRLERVGVTDVTVSTLTINYRTPVEVMTEAEPMIRTELPDANVPTSVRSTGVPVQHGSVAELETLVDGWLAENPEGIGCVIGHPAFGGRPRVQSLAPETAKGLEFDLVVIVDPQRFGTGIEGAVDRYVAMTRATQRLIVLTSDRDAVTAGGSLAGATGLA